MARNEYNFNTPEGQTIDRELLICCLNTGTSAEPVWSVIGKRVEESNIEYDWGEETKRDIIGEIHSSMNKPTMTQTFDPYELDAGDIAHVKIWKTAVVEQDTNALCNMDMLIIHSYANFAERYESSMIKPSSLGGPGGGKLTQPFDVTYGGKRTIGSAAKDADGKIVFTPAA